MFGRKLNESLTPVIHIRKERRYATAAALRGETPHVRPRMLPIFVVANLIA